MNSAFVTNKFLAAYFGCEPRQVVNSQFPFERGHLVDSLEEARPLRRVRPLFFEVLA